QLWILKSIKFSWIQEKSRKYIVGYFFIRIKHYVIPAFCLLKPSLHLRIHLSVIMMNAGKPYHSTQLIILYITIIFHPFQFYQKFIYMLFYCFVRFCQKCSIFHIFLLLQSLTCCSKGSSFSPAAFILKKS